MSEDSPKTPMAGPAQNQQVGGATTGVGVGAPVPATGRRNALQGLRRQLTDDELTNPGVQKLLLDELERADTECDELRMFRSRFHESSLEVAVLEEQLKTAKAIEIFFGVGVGLGCAIIGLAPLFWVSQPQGGICLGLGVAMVIGSTVARVVKK